MVGLRREEGKQNVGFSSRPFVLCGLPVRRPPAREMLSERRNGDFVLQITGHPNYGLPFGQDRIVPIYLATLAVRQQSQTIRFRTAAVHQIETALHKRTGAAVTNFERTLPPPQSYLAQQITRDPYTFDFLMLAAFPNTDYPKADGRFEGELADD